MSVIFGSARSDSRGKYSGDAKGDSRQTASPDYSGEVSLQDGYVHSKGWNVIRLKDTLQAASMAAAMRQACNNANIGYDQSGRDDILKHGTGSTVKTECDCSSLIRQCFKEATGVDPGDFYTGNERTVLCATGLCKKVTFTSLDDLLTGDILVTKRKGHTVCVVQGKDSSAVVYPCWIENNNIWYYRLSQGVNAHGWRLIENADGNKRWYYFASDGAMQTGKIAIGEDEYCLQDHGSWKGSCMQTDSAGRLIDWIVNE